MHYNYRSLPVEEAHVFNLGDRGRPCLKTKKKQKRQEFKLALLLYHKTILKLNFQIGNYKHHSIVINDYKLHCKSCDYFVHRAISAALFYESQSKTKQNKTNA